jgi:hypothetical protein
MRGFRALTWWGLAVFCASAGCREHEPVCNGAQCSAAAAFVAGASGAPALPDDDDVVAAGGAPSSGCASDAACDNMHSCDGQERCVQGRCESGTPMVCPDGTVCREGEAEACGFEEASPWLLTSSQGDLWGLPTRELARGGQLRRLLRGTQEPREHITTVTWAPDGSQAIASTALPQFRAGFLSLAFGEGLPSAPTRLRDVPLWVTGLGDPYFSPDSRYVFVYDWTSGSYLVSLKDDRPTQLIPAIADESVDAIFCDPTSSWFQVYGFYTVAVGGLTDDGLVTRELGEADSFEVSPNRRLLALSRYEAAFEPLGVTLTSCASDQEWTFELAEASSAAFSPDSQVLWLDYEYQYRQALYSIADPRNPVLLFDSEGAGFELSSTFTPDARRILATTEDGMAVIEIARGRDGLALLGFPEFSTLLRLTDEHIVVWADTGDGRAMQKQSLSPTGAPRVLFDDPERDAVIFEDPRRPERLFVADPREQMTDLRMIDIDEEDVESKVMLTVEGRIGDLRLSPDGRGMAFILASTGETGTPFWVTFDEEGEPSAPRRLTEGGFVVEFQPWP